VQIKPWRPLPDVLADAAAGDHDPAGLAEVVYAAVARYVPFDFACFALTDPATGLVTWASKTRSLGVGDERFAAVEYGPPDINSFAEIATRTPPVGALSVDTDGDLMRCRRHRDLMAPQFGFTDELRVVFPSRGVTWGMMALYRAGDDPHFTADDAREVGAITPIIGAAIARSLFRAAPHHITSGAPAQAVMIIDAANHVTHLTASAEQAVQELGGWDHGSLPANVLAVVSATRTRGTNTETVVHTPSAGWLTLKAAALTGPAGDSDTVVTVEPTPRTALGRLALAAYGLTAREQDVALLVLQGASTHAIADTLHLSPHTVQDHLKKIFGKTGVTSRRDLTARLALQ
jgi:DNA-binding CsgD family transcriptional regulator